MCSVADLQPVRRVAMRIEFDGRRYCGFQRQDSLPTIQSALEQAIAPLSKAPATCVTTGRTDTGVHALGLVIHFDLVTHHSAEKLKAAMNGRLRGEDIAVLEAREAPSDFHARFSATARQYRYIVMNRQAPPRLMQNRCWHVPRALDLNAMRSAAKFLIGLHDFTSFRSSQCQSRSPIKTLSKLSLRKSGDLIIFTVKAPSFLHHQVRNLVGTLVEVGTGNRKAECMSEILDARDRSKAGVTAPASGLYFVQAFYPSDIDPFLRDFALEASDHDPD